MYFSNSLAIKETTLGYTMVASTMMRMKKIEQSLDFYSKAIECDKKNYLGWVGKAEILIMLNKKQDALKVLDEAIKVVEDQTKLLLVLGKINIELDKLDVGLEFYSKYFELNNKDFVNYYEVGKHLLEKNHLDQAKNYFIKVLQIKEKYLDTFCILGDVESKFKNYTAANDYYDKELKFNENKEKDFPSNVTKGKLNILFEQMSPEFVKKAEEVAQKFEKFTIDAHYLIALYYEKLYEKSKNVLDIEKARNYADSANHKSNYINKQYTDLANKLNDMYNNFSSS